MEDQIAMLAVENQDAVQQAAQCVGHIDPPSVAINVDLGPDVNVYLPPYDSVTSGNASVASGVNTSTTTSATSSVIR